MSQGGLSLVEGQLQRQLDPPWAAGAAPPPIPRLAIRRPRLERLLDEHAERRVVLVRGPTGAGKTVLVSQWVAAGANPCVWVALDQSHNDRRALLDRLDDAVMQARLDVPLTLVLDDVHRLDDPEALAMLAVVVEHVPETMRLVLTGRRIPPIGVPRARLRGDLLEIPPPALRFDRAEIGALVRTWTGRPADATDVQRLTLGWAAGLRLAELGLMSGDGSLADVTPSDPAVEYVRDELLADLPPSLVSFLFATCWLPALTGPLCEAVTGEPAATSLLHDAVCNLPIAAVASRPGSYRYPPLLAQLLRAEAVHNDDTSAAARRRAAAEACRRAGELDMAVELFLAGRWYDDAADTCAALASDGTALASVHQRLEQMPDATFLGDGPRLGLRVRAALAAGHPDDARSWLARGAPPDRRNEDGNGAIAHDLLVAQAEVAQRAGDVATMLRCADDLVGCETDAATERRAQAWRIRALSWAGDPDAARAALSALDAAPDPGHETPLVARELDAARAWVAWFDGDMATTATLARCATDDASADAALDAELLLLTAVARREQNQLAEAVTLLGAALDAARQCSHTIAAALAASEQARAHRAAGAVLPALETVVSARRTHLDLPAAVDAHLRATEARLWLDQGDIDGAATAAETGRTRPDDVLLAARVALATRPAEASDQLDAVDPRTPRQAVERDLLRARLPHRGGEDRVTDVLAAVAHGTPLGLVRTFLDEGPEVLLLIREVSSERRDTDLGRLAGIAAEEMARAPLMASADPVTPLTLCELNVLRLLATPLSNREMAEQLYVSVNTLKSHLRSIYRKLEVGGRVPAVRRARALELV